MTVTDMCRLCLSTYNLVWIFDEENSKLNMNNVIYLTTGIEIHMTDVISQKVCANCLQFCVAIFQFRSQCVKADKYFKSLYLDYLVNQKCYIPNTEVTIEREEDEKSKITPVRTNNECVHPSVVKLSRLYPTVKLPSICLSSNVTPIVEMELEKVENYFRRLKLDFNQCARDALEYANSKESLLDEMFMSEELPVREVFEENAQTLLNLLLSTSVKIPEKQETDHSLIDLSSSDTKNINDSSETSRKRKYSTLKKVKSDHDEADAEQVEKRRKTVETNKTTVHDKAAYAQRTSNNKLIMGDYLNKNIDKDEVTNDNYKVCLETSLDKNSNIEIAKGGKLATPSNIETTDEEAPTHQCDISEKTDQLEDRESLTSVDRSVPLHVCDICNSVQYTMHDLKKHQNKHTKCQFCKMKFRTIEHKTYHIENVCIIKRMMRDLPDVVLERIEYDEKIRRRYPSAFIKFKPLPCMETNEPNSISSIFSNCPQVEIIEILSDDESDIIKPDILINGFPFDLDFDANNEVILKNLIAKLQKPPTDAQHQTSEPLSEIVIDKKKIILKNLLGYLRHYKNIPIHTQYGEFDAFYAKNVKVNPIKKLELWNVMAPLDVKLQINGCD